MLYAALTLWIALIVLAAWAVHWLWTRLIPPRVVHALLLPGTVAAQIGHVLGVLLAGGTVNNASLIKSDGSNEPQPPAESRTRIPVLGPVIVAVFPLAACAAGVALAARSLGAETVAAVGNFPAAMTIPTSLTGLWQFLHHLVFLMETLTARLREADLSTWQGWAFLYLAICLTVRMAPLQGNLPGALGGIALFGVVCATVGSLSPAFEALILDAWPLLTFVAALLLVLLLLSAVAAALVALVRGMATGQAARSTPRTRTQPAA